MIDGCLNTLNISLNTHMLVTHKSSDFVEIPLNAKELFDPTHLVGVNSSSKKLSFM